MRKKYKLKKKRKLISVYSILIIFIVLILAVAVAYSKFSENLTINGYVTGEQIDDATVYASNMKISIDKDGILTLNGNINDNKNYFVKFSNGLDVKTNISTDVIFNEWFAQDDTTLASAGDIVKHSVEIISGSTSKDKELNVVIRDSTNTAILKCELAANILQTNTILTSDAKVHYLYLKAGLQCKNLKIRTKIEKSTELIKVSKINMNPGKSNINGITCEVNSKKQLVINGTSKGSMFIKLTDGVIGATSMNKDWIASGKVFAKTGDIVDLSAKVISGTMTGTNQANLCARTIDNKMDIALKLISNQFTSSETTKKNLCVIYIYIDKSIVFDNYILEPHLLVNGEDCL